MLVVRTLILAASAALLALSAEGIRVFVGGNFHTIDAQRLYRCSQPGPERLRGLIKTYGIKTVVNLRGCCDPTPWYRDEATICQEMGANLEDLAFSANRLPSSKAFKQLADVLEQAEEPLLIHCNRGIDRTGLASAVWQLLKTDATPAKAYWQLSPRFGHFRFGRTAHMDEAIDMYIEWLAVENRVHSPAQLHDYIEHHYCPGILRANLAWESDWPPHPLPNQPKLISVRATNTSLAPWTMTAGDNAGVHLAWRLIDAKAQSIGGGVSGLMDRMVEPGESLRIDVPLPGLPTGGPYRLQVDLVDPQHATFLQAGGELLEGTFMVREAKP